MNVISIVQLFPAANDFGHRLTVTNSWESPPDRIEKRGSLIVNAAFPWFITVTLLMVIVAR
jgi:hypothetical protein